MGARSVIATYQKPDPNCADCKGEGRTKFTVAMPPLFRDGVDIETRWTRCPCTDALDSGTMVREGRESK